MSSFNSAHKSSRNSALYLAALGVVYGDIGTSPLYSIKEVFAGNHKIPASDPNILGSLSLFFWVLIIIVSIKYLIFIMRADNKGEGGIISLIALALHDIPENGKKHKAIIVIGILGAAMFYGDGIVTPAISVISAIEGMEVVAPSLERFVIPITLIILFFLFFFQHKGTAKVGAWFGPVMMVWFTVLALLGVRNIIANPHVFLAMNPLYGLEFLINNRAMALLAMGNVVLAVTGAEALYADMGHFGRKPIQRVWFAFVLPALMLNYFGQGALILSHPEAAENPFFLSAPGWALIPLVILATVATVIASQAVITGAYSMSRQAMQLGFLPRLDVQHTSEEEAGQIYLPGVNWGLFAAICILVISFKSSNNLAAAYGLAVTGSMVTTSLLATVVVARIWGWGWFKAVALFSCFLIIELVFLSANLLKIPDGGWFPLVAGIVIFTLMTTWKRGRKLLADRLRGESLSLDAFVNSLMFAPPLRVSGTAVYMNATPFGVPHALLHNLMHNKVLHERVVILSCRIMDSPYVAESERIEVHSLQGDFYQIVVSFGFMDSPNIPQALRLCTAYDLEFEMMETTFFIGRETLIPRLGSEMAFWREKLFITMARNASSATDFFCIPSNRVVELGAQVVL